MTILDAPLVDYHVLNGICEENRIIFSLFRAKSSCRPRPSSDTLWQTIADPHRLSFAALEHSSDCPTAEHFYFTAVCRDLNDEHRTTERPGTTRTMIIMSSFKTVYDSNTDIFRQSLFSFLKEERVMSQKICAGQIEKVCRPIHSIRKQEDLSGKNHHFQRNLTTHGRWSRSKTSKMRSVSLLDHLLTNYEFINDSH